MSKEANFPKIPLKWSNNDIAWHLKGNLRAYHRQLGKSDKRARVLGSLQPWHTHDCH